MNRVVTTSTDIDLMSEALAANPWPALRELRERGPVLWHESQRRWIITTDSAAREVLLDFERFTVRGTVMEDLFGPDAFICSDDRQHHAAMRNIWAHSFRPAGLQQLRQDITAIVDELTVPLWDKLRSGETVDLSDALCRPLPTLVIARMMGVSEDMLADVVRWSDAMAGGGPAYLDAAVREAAIRAREEAKNALADYLTGLIRERRRAPTDDLVGMMVKAEVVKPFSDEQLVQNLRQLLFAGNETTARWLAHIFLTYGQNRDTQRELRSRPALIPAANEEVLRWQGVVGTLPRRVKGSAVKVAGIDMADGDHITCLTGCANRDPQRFVNPDEFDIHRPPQPHLGFGVGLHNCLGAALARLEVLLAAAALLQQVPEYTIAAPFHYTPLPVRGPLPVVIGLDG